MPGALPPKNQQKRKKVKPSICDQYHHYFEQARLKWNLYQSSFLPFSPMVVPLWDFKFSKDDSSFDQERTLKLIKILNKSESSYLKSRKMLLNIIDNLSFSLKYRNKYHLFFTQESEEIRHKHAREIHVIALIESVKSFLLFIDQSCSKIKPVSPVLPSPKLLPKVNTSISTISKKDGKIPQRCSQITISSIKMNSDVSQKKQEVDDYLEFFEKLDLIAHCLCQFDYFVIKQSMNIPKSPSLMCDIRKQPHISSLKNSTNTILPPLVSLMEDGMRLTMSKHIYQLLCPNKCTFLLITPLTDMVYVFYQKDFEDLISEHIDEHRFITINQSHTDKKIDSLIVPNEVFFTGLLQEQPINSYQSFYQSNQKFIQRLFSLLSKVVTGANLCPDFDLSFPFSVIDSMNHNLSFPINNPVSLFRHILMVFFSICSLGPITSQKEWQSNYLKFFPHLSQLALYMYKI